MNDKVFLGISIAWVIAEVSLLIITIFSMSLEVVRFSGLGLFSLLAIMEIYRMKLEKKRNE